VFSPSARLGRKAPFDDDADVGAVYRNHRAAGHAVDRLRIKAGVFGASSGTSEDSRRDTPT